jgi:hypothetical protein
MSIRWLDSKDLLSKVLPVEQEKFLLLLDDGETIVQGEPWFNNGCLSVREWYCELPNPLLSGTTGIDVPLERVVAVLPMTWLLDLDLKCFGSTLDVERYANVNTYKEYKDTNNA